MDKAERERAVLDARRRGDVPYLIEALRDPDAREFAARGLQKLGARKAIPPLMILLRVSDAKTRTTAANAVGALRAAEAVADLIALAERDADIAVRSAALRALAKIGDRRANAVFLATLDDESWFVRVTGAWALGELGDTTAIEPLRRAAAKERFFARRAYRKAIRQIKKRSRAAETY